MISLLVLMVNLFDSLKFQTLHGKKTFSPAIYTDSDKLWVPQKNIPFMLTDFSLQMFPYICSCQTAAILILRAIQRHKYHIQCLRNTDRRYILQEVTEYHEHKSQESRHGPNNKELAFYESNYHSFSI